MTSVAPLTERAVVVPVHDDAVVGSAGKVSVTTQLRDSYVTGGGVPVEKLPSVATRELHVVRRAPVFTPMPEVTALLKKCGVRARIDRPRERFLRWLAPLHDEVSRCRDPDEVVQRLTDGDARMLTFMLEGLYRLYAKRYPQLEGDLAAIKLLEDRLGDYSTARSLIAAVADPPAKLAKKMASDCEVARKRLTKLVQRSWMPASKHGVGSALGRMVEHLTAVSWDDTDADRSVLRRGLHDCLDKVQSGTYDLDDFENGLHPMRRHMRWFTVYATAADGAVTFENTSTPIPDYKALLRGDAAVLPVSETPRESMSPIEINRAAYVLLAQAVYDLGEVKDVQERVEMLSEYFHQAGEKHSRKKARHCLSVKKSVMANEALLAREAAAAGFAAVAELHSNLV